MTDETYRFGQVARLETARLTGVERAFDPVSRAALSEAGVRRGWRCWEVGAGRGSIARWLSDTVGPDGHVLATDLDARWFERGGASNITFLVHDVTRDAPPDQEFELVHARFVLEHLDDPPAVIARLAGVLAPGGTLVLEDAAGLEFGSDPPSDAFARLIPAWERAGASVGWDAAYGWRLARDLRRAGLTAVTGLEYRRFAPGGEAFEHVAAGLERLRDQVRDLGVDPADLAAALDTLRDPGHGLTGPPVVIAWGYSPPGSEPPEG